MLSNEDILKARSKGLGISPWRPGLLGPCSYDLTLGGDFLVPHLNHVTTLADEECDYSPVTGERLLLHSGQTVLGTTIERVKIPLNLCGILDGKSRWARRGLAVHSTASMIQPGFEGRITLELTNTNRKPVVLRMGDEVAQIRFERLETPASVKYNGRYADQEGPQL